MKNILQNKQQQARKAEITAEEQMTVTHKGKQQTVEDQKYNTTDVDDIKKDGNTSGAPLMEKEDDEEVHTPQQTNNNQSQIYNEIKTDTTKILQTNTQHQTRLAAGRKQQNNDNSIAYDIEKTEVTLWHIETKESEPRQYEDNNNNKGNVEEKDLATQ